MHNSLALDLMVRNLRRTLAELVEAARRYPGPLADERVAGVRRELARMVLS